MIADITMEERRGEIRRINTFINIRDDSTRNIPVGTNVGASVGSAVGTKEGTSVGLAVGDAERKEWRKINRQMKF